MKLKLVALLIGTLCLSVADARNVVVRNTGRVTPPPVCGGSGVVYLTTVGSSTWTPPVGFCSTNNSVEVIGGGGAASTGQSSVSYSTGGGGGAYAVKLNVSFTVGVPAAINIGVGGTASATPNTAGPAGTDTFICLTVSNCSSIIGTGVVAGAKGGGGGGIGFTTAIRGGLGGQASASIGDTKFNGGNGAPQGDTVNYITMTTGGGGGAGCYAGDGGNGGSSGQVTQFNTGGGGGGGGGGACGYWGSTPRTSTQGAITGGFGHFGGSYGRGGATGNTPTNGTMGTQGAGGGGGGNGIRLSGSGGGITTCGNGGNGAAGTEMDNLHGAGGGGGAAGYPQTGTTGCSGGNGGLYGGGGGAATITGTQPGNGAGGLIRISWPAFTPPPPTDFAGIADTRYTCVTNYWISPSGNDSNPGTITQPRKRYDTTWNSLSGPGVCINALSGIYVQPSTLSNSNITSGGGNQDTITGYAVLRCDVPLTCTITGTPINLIDVSNQPSANPVDFGVIDGFNINGPTFTSTSSLGQSGTRNAIEVGFGHHWKIINSNIYGASFAGVQTQFFDYLLLKNDNIYQNAWAGLESSGVSLIFPYQIDGASSYHNLIQNNKCWGNSQSSFNVPNSDHTDGECFILDTWGATRAYLGSVLFEQNLVHHNGHRGIEGLCNTVTSPLPAMGNIMVRNNTVWENDLDPYVGVGGELYFMGCSNLTVVNNNVGINGNLGAPSIPQAFPALYSQFTGGGATFHNNSFWCPPIYISSCINSDVSVSNGDANGNIVGVTPLITAPSMDDAISDWYLQSASPLRNAGTTAYGYPALDLGGNPRVVGGQIDIGAYEGGHTATWMQAGSTIDLNGAYGITSTGLPFASYLAVTNSTGGGDMTVSSPPNYPYLFYRPNLPRIAYSGSNTAGPGLLIEPLATNYFINSRIARGQDVNGGNPVPAGQYTLWVNGYNVLGGTATLSGCASGTATQGVQLNVTLLAPAVCTVTVTNGGSPFFRSDLVAVQFENSPTATSYIPTTGAIFDGSSPGTCTGTNLQVTFATGAAISAGWFIEGAGVPAGDQIVSQVSGTTGGNGCYVTSMPTPLSNVAMNGGLTASRSSDYVLLSNAALSTAIGSAASLLVSANGSAKTSPIYILQGDGYTLLESTTSTTISGLTPTLAATFGSGSIASTTSAATAFDGTGRSIVVNNGTVATDTNIPATNTAVAVGDTQAGAGNEYYGSISDMALWASRLNNSTLQGLTN